MADTASVNARFLQSLQTALGRAVLPLAVRPAGVRLEPVQMTFNAGAAAFAAGDVLASLSAGSLVEVSYPNTAPSGYYASRGGTGEVFAGYIDGVSADMAPHEANGATSTLAELAVLFEALNLVVKSFGVIVEFPLREALKIAPNVATGNLNDFTNGACPMSGKPTYPVAGGWLWQGAPQDDIQIVANRAYIPVVAAAVRFDLRLWGALASLDSNQRQRIADGSVPARLPCGDDGSKTIAAMVGVLQSGPFNGVNLPSLPKG